MAQSRPKFKAPPVVETVLSIQFANLPGYSTAHAGWFWKVYLENPGGQPSLKWSQVVDAPRLEDEFERFGAEEKWVVPHIKLLPPSQSQRTQIIRSDGERMAQVQDSRFILNWKKQAGVYPSFDPAVRQNQIRLKTIDFFRCRPSP